MKSVNSHRLLFIFVLAASLLFIRLGFWQLSRAQEKEALLVAWQQAERMPPQVLPSGNDAMLYRPVTAQGTFDQEHVFLFDNQSHKGQVGYHVISPFYPQGAAFAVLVNRGFVAAPLDRAQWPQIPQVSGLVTVSGRLSTIPILPWQFGSEMIEKKGNVWRMQHIDLSAIQKAIARPLQPYLLLLDPQVKEYGFMREWSMQTLHPGRHKGYALQWFAFALIIWIIFGVLHFERKKFQSP